MPEFAEIFFSLDTTSFITSSVNYQFYHQK